MNPDDIFVQGEMEKLEEQFPDESDLRQVLGAVITIATLMLELGPKKGKAVLQAANNTIERYEAMT